jgi:hypothetical protein
MLVYKRKKLYCSCFFFHLENIGKFIKISGKTLNCIFQFSVWKNIKFKQEDSIFLYPPTLISRKLKYYSDINNPMSLKLAPRKANK